jgi:hypothetical protein
MRKKITDTSAAQGLGNPGQAKLFRVSTGAYVNRRVALVQTSPTEIKLTWSDTPGSNWSNLTSVVSDARDGAFDARMSPNGDIHLVYSIQTTNYLTTRKLTLGEGSWSVGSAVTVYNGAQCFDPSLAIASDGSLWVAYSRFVSPSRSIYVKSSTDDGATWGSGAGDAGDQISGVSTFAWSRLVIDSLSVHTIYHNQDTALSIRSRALSGGSWSTAYNIATGSGFDRNFDAAVAPDNRLGVVFSRDQLYYREYDGANWGALTVLEDQPVICPQLLFENNIPAALYLDMIGGNVQVPMQTDRRTGSFSTPTQLDDRMAPLQSVLLYNAVADSYEDLTVQAGNQTAADVYHSANGSLVKDAGDALYLGLDTRFRFARLVLSTAGTGGTIISSYFDGAEWNAFTPANGVSDLSASPSDLLLWTDFGSIPDDWQKRTVNGLSRYWVKVEVASEFTTGPVGSQISAASELNRIIFRR